jgi:hypothetical protein
MHETLSYSCHKAANGIFVALNVLAILALPIGGAAVFYVSDTPPFPGKAAVVTGTVVVWLTFCLALASLAQLIRYAASIASVLFHMSKGSGCLGQSPAQAAQSTKGAPLD